MNRPRDRASAAGQLKLCPFCGAGKHVELWDRFDGGYIAHVHCESCGADGPSIYSEYGADTAIKRARASWNGRSQEYVQGVTFADVQAAIAAREVKK